MKTIITPEKAKKLLKNNNKNRQINFKMVSELSRQMIEDKWVYNGETIKISNTGRLLDGQHRLWACINSNKPFETELIENIEDSSFNTIDVGRNRNLVHLLFANGERYWVEKSIFTKDLWYWEKHQYKYNCKKSFYLRQNLSFEYYKENKETIDQVVSITIKKYKNKRVDTIVPFSKLMLIYYVLTSIDEEKTLDFLDKLIYGANLPINSPVLFCRNTIINERVKYKNNFDYQYILLDFVFRTWNLYIKNETPKKFIGLNNKSNELLTMPEGLEINSKF